MTYRYLKSMRLRNRRQFQRLARSSTRFVGQWIVIETCRNQQMFTRLGITATRKYGKAIHRNRFKRIVREAFRLSRQQLKLGYDFNVKPRSTAYAAKTDDILNELIHFFGQ